MNKDAKKSTQGVPSNYFESFADKMMAGIKAANDSASEPVLNYPKNMPYSVPDGYFDQQIASFSHSLQLVQQLDNKQSWPRTLPFDIPAGNYFDTLSDTILSKITTAAAVPADLSFLDSVKHLPTYQVPEGYFEQFSVPIPTSTSKATVIEFNAKKKKANWMQWSAAACMLIIFSMGAFWMSNSSMHEDVKAFQLASKQLDMIPADAIDEYIDEEFDNYDIYASMIDGQEQKIISKASYSILNDISDQDLEAYLEIEGI